VSVNRRHRIGGAEILLREQGIHRIRIEAAEDLLDEGARMLDDTGRTGLAGARFLLAAQLARCVHIFESVIALCRIGRGVPAAMLNRALFEEVLGAHWIAMHPEKAPVFAGEYERALDLADHDLHERLAKRTPMTVAERAELKEVMKKYKGFQRSWTLASETELRGLLKSSWGPRVSRHLDYVYEGIQRWNSVFLHAGPAGYRMAMGDGQTQVNRIGPDQLWRESIANGCLAFYSVLRVIADEWEFDRSGAESVFFYASCVTKRLSDSELRAIRDGEPCPCGSGRSVEDCHRSQSGPVSHRVSCSVPARGSAG
jgi:Family of unknown function (DUF5677)